MNKSNWTSRHNWLFDNAHHFEGAIKLSAGKRPIGKEFKASHWQFHSNNLPEDRMADCIEHEIANPESGIAILTGSKFLVIDLDAKEGASVNKNARLNWAEIFPDVPETMPSSGSGAHIYCKRPTRIQSDPVGLKTNMAALGFEYGDKDLVTIEIFAGVKQYISVPKKEFNWDSLDLDNLPEVPAVIAENLIKHVAQQSSKVTVELSDWALARKYKLPQGREFIDLALTVDKYPAIRTEHDAFMFMTAMSGIAKYYENIDKSISDGIKAVFMYRCAMDAGFDEVGNLKMWDRNRRGYGTNKSRGYGSLKKVSSYVNGGMPNADEKATLAEYAEGVNYWIPRI